MRMGARTGGCSCSRLSVGRRAQGTLGTRGAGGKAGRRWRKGSNSAWSWSKASCCSPSPAGCVCSTTLACPPRRGVAAARGRPWRRLWRSPRRASSWWAHAVCRVLHAFAVPERVSLSLPNPPLPHRAAQAWRELSPSLHGESSLDAWHRVCGWPGVVGLRGARL